MSHVDDGMLHAYLDGELSPTEAQGIDAHLAQCPGCRARLDEERALIARAAELLALAAPPLPLDRAPPPVGGRRWWHVRLPLAWAATVALALGMGWYLGGSAFLLRAPSPATEAQLDSTASELTAPTLATRTPHPSRAPRPIPRHADAPAAQPIAGAAVPTAPPSPAIAMQRRAERESVVAAPLAGGRAPVVALAPRPSLAASKVNRAAAPLPVAVPITLDSARLLLGQDPVALPDVPIRAVRHERIAGEVVVVVEQALDSTAVIELRERRPPPGRPFDEGAVSANELRVEISGPLPADSLKRLLDRVRPVKP